MKKDFNHILLSNVIDSLKLFLIAVGIATSVAQGAVEASNEAESYPIRFESRDWAEAVYNAASASDSIVIEGGRLKEDAVWAPPETHLVFNSVYVPKDITLTIVTNCVVKFCEGTFIKVEDGGKLNIVGAEDKEVILTAANDNTVGTTIPELDPEQSIKFIGIVLQSTVAQFIDNGWLEIRGFVFSLLPNISLADQTVYRKSGLATIPITVTGTRNQSFMIDWVAEDGSATYSNDYTVASGRIIWENTGSGTKSIEIPLVVDHLTGSNTTFTVRIKAAHGANIIKGVAVVNISEMIFLNIESAEEESEPIRFESRSWAEAVFNSASTNEMIIIEGGRLKENTIWAPLETHLVFNIVYIPSGITLTIVTNTIVKFCEGTFIKVEDGGKLDIIGAEGGDVILTSANDNTVGEPISGLDPEQIIEFPGIILQSTQASFADNCWIQTRGFSFGNYPTLSFSDTDVFRSSGVVNIRVDISGTRNQMFFMDWEAEDGSATLSNDYTLASGRLSWANTYEGSKNIEIPIVTDHIVGSNTTFKVKVAYARGVNIGIGECTVTIKELKDIKFESGSMESASIRFESRPWAEAVMNAASTNDMVILEGGRLKSNMIWGPPKTHLVFNSVYVPNGITLTIVTNTVVKFCEGTFIKIEDGGQLNVIGEEDHDVILTAANDDSVGQKIPGLKNDETFFFGGILLSSEKAILIDNGHLDTRGFSISRYPTLTLHEATANRNSGVIYIPITINSVTRNQAFSVDWVAEEGSAKFNVDYTLASGRISWANSYEGQKNIEIPIVKDHVVDDNSTFTVKFSVLRGVNANVKEIIATIAEFKTGELTLDTIVEQDDSVLSSQITVIEDINLKPIFLNEVESIQYSGKWQKFNVQNAEKLRVTLESNNGIEVLKETGPTETGSFDFKVSNYPVGFYTLKHEIVDFEGKTLAIMQKNFSVLDTENVEMHGGTLTQNEIWSSNKVHVVYETVYVPTIYTLFIEPGTIVKFVKNTGIVLLGEAAFFANGITFTNIDDDTVGGDTLSDGYTGKSSVDAYFLIGNFHFSGDTELRNITQLEPITGMIASDKILPRGSIYRISGTLRVMKGASLTILPGTIIKMESGASIEIENGGNLNAIGTHVAPIIITSVKDDSVGGDTNKDGNQTYPNVGDWKVINNSGTLNLSYVNLYYGGYGLGLNGAMIWNSGEAVLDCCSVKHSYHVLLRSYGGKMIAKNCIIEDGNIGVEGNIYYYPNLINCIVSKCNSAGSYAKMDNSIIWFCGNGSYNSMSKCIAYGDSTAVPDGIVYANPLFLDPENGDYRIQENSPCVDAADVEIAPNTDYFGQSRITITSTGTNVLGRLPDIGICEVMPRNVTSDVDLVPQSIGFVVTNALSGQQIYVKWEIVNNGGQEITGSWRDTIYLVSETGLEVEIGEKLTTGSICSGGSVFCSGYFTVPAISEGIWYPKVNVNSYHDVFEGKLISNNALKGDKPITINIETIDPSVPRQGIARPGVQNVIKLVFDENDKNRMVSLGLVKGVRVTWGFGFVPTSGETIPGMSGSSVSVGNEPVQFRVPEDVTEVYIIIETDETITYDLSTKATELLIKSITPNYATYGSCVQAILSGSGFSLSNSVAFVSGNNRVLIDSKYMSSDLLNLTFDTSLLIPGTRYDLVVIGENSETRFADAFNVIDVASPGKIEAKLDLSHWARPGRKATGYIEYSNVGSSAIDAPIFVISSDVRDTRFCSFTGGENWTNTLMLVGIGNEYPKGQIKPGETIRLPFKYMIIGGFQVSLSIVDVDSDLSRNSVYPSWKEFSEAIASAATKINGISGTISDYETIYDYAIKTGYGSRNGIVRGQLLSDLTEKPLPGYVVATIDADGIIAERARTDNEGRFLFSDLVETNTYRLAGAGFEMYGVGGIVPRDMFSTDVLVYGHPYASISVQMSFDGDIKETRNGFEPQLCTSDGMTLPYHPVLEDGAFIFSDISDGEYLLTAVSSNNQYVVNEPVTLSISCGKADKDEYIVPLVSCGHLAIKLLMDGEPVSGVLCEAESETFSTSGISDTNGVVLLNMKGGMYSLSVYNGYRFIDLCDNTIEVNVNDDLKIEKEVCFVPFVAFPDIGPKPLPVKFNVEYIKNHDEIDSLAWDFDNDGVVDSTESTPTWVFEESGLKKVSLTVTYTNGVSKTYSETSIKVWDNEYIEYDETTLILDEESGYNILERDENSVTLKCIDETVALSLSLFKYIIFPGEEEKPYEILGHTFADEVIIVTLKQAQISDACKGYRILSVGELDTGGMCSFDSGDIGSFKKSAILTTYSGWIKPEEDRKKRYRAEAYLEIDFSAGALYYEMATEKDENDQVILQSFRLYGESTHVLKVKGGLGTKNEKLYRRAKHLQGRPWVPFSIDDMVFSAFPPLGGSIGVKVEANASFVGEMEIPILINFNTGYRRSIDSGIQFQHCDNTFKLSDDPQWLKINCGIEFDVKAYLYAELYGGVNFGVKKIAKFGAKLCDIKAEGGIHCKTSLKISSNEFEQDKLDITTAFIAKFIFTPLIVKMESGLFNWQFVPAKFEWTPSEDSLKIEKLCFSIGTPVPRLNIDKRVESDSGVLYNFSDITQMYYPWTKANSGVLDCGDNSEMPVKEGENNYHLYPYCGEDTRKYIVKLTQTYELFSKKYFHNKSSRYSITVNGDPSENPVEVLDEATGEMAHGEDPNEMSGPLGIGDPETERFVVPGEWLTYTVYFENTSNATAAAQEVYVTNPLSQYLDWSTFEMGDIAFNNQIDLGLAGRQSGTSEVTANGTNYNVRTQLTLDTEKGEAKWYMRIVDPTTETGWPDDILIGFLPPNDETYRGEGHLSYRVKVRDDAPAGVTIRNSATIIFDYNDPIETDPAWWNRVAQVQNILIDGTNVTKIVGFPYGKLPVPGARKGWIFVGWFTGPNGTGRLITEDSLVEEGDTALYQYWVRDWHDLNKDDETNAVSDTYDGYIYDVDTHDIKGSIQVKVGKPKNGNAKVTGTVVLVGGTKSDIKATMTMSDTKIDTVLKNGRPLKLVLSSNGMMGTLDKWEISGVRNFFLSKAPGDQAIAETALNQMQGVYTVAWEEGAGYVFASIAIGKKGKAKATGYMANGTKFSAAGQLLIGKEEHCVTLVSKSGKTPVGFNLWFTADKSLETEGTQGISVAGKLRALGAHSFFTCDYLTEPIPVDATGKKWSVTASKLLAFKLSYKDSAGSFKGSFKVGKEKATVNGVVVEGVGYGTAVTKSNGAKAVIIKEIE